MDVGSLMPRPRHAQGRPATRVIPDDWETTHRPVVEKTLTATAALRHPGTASQWDPATRQNRETPQAPYWTGPARVQALRTGSARTVVTVGDREVAPDYLLVVPALVTGVTDGDRVRITGSGDPMLDGHDLLVAHAATGTERFERDLFCTLAS